MLLLQGPGRHIGLLYAYPATCTATLDWTARNY